MSNYKSNNLLYKFIVFWLFFYVLFAERFVLKIKTGGKGIVSIPALITVLLFLYIFIKSKGRDLKLFRSKFFSYWRPFVILTILLPIMGVLLRSYPLRTIFNLNLISEISFLIIGYWVSKRITSWEFIFRRYLLVAIVIEFLYSFFQFLYQKGFILKIFWFRFYMWDVTSQQLYASPIFGRSIGTFVNPNTLGFWALIVFGFSLYLVKGHLKLILIALSFLTLILSQSRGSFFGLIFFFIVSLSINLIRPKKFSFKKFFRIYILFFLTILTGMFFIKFNFIDFEFFNRLKSAIEVFLYGIYADKNFSTRVDIWNQSLKILKIYPLGTFGPPELVLGNAIDSDWVRLMLQGSVIYVVSFLIMLIGGTRIRIINKKREAEFFLYMSLVLPIVAIAETPTIYIPMALYWFVLGAQLQEITQINLKNMVNN